jgi:hypothetical protein
MEAPMTAKIGISGVLEYRDAEGNVIKTVEVSGALAVPGLDETNLETKDGLDDCARSE